VSDNWAAGDGHDLEVHDPNGFFRAFRDGASAAAVAVTLRYDAYSGEVTLTLGNTATQRVTLTISDAYENHRATVAVRPGRTVTKTYDVRRNHGWYDLAVRADGHADFLQRFAGYLENGRDSISDPLMGGMR
jgi:phospholipase C